MGVIRPAVNMNGWLNGWRLIIWHHLLCWSWCKMILIALFSNCITCLCCQAKEASEHPIKVTGRLWFVMLRKHDPLGKQQVFLSLQNCPEWSHLQLKMILTSVFEEVFASWHFSVSQGAPTRIKPSSRLFDANARAWALATVRGRSWRRPRNFDAAFHKRFLQWCHICREKPFKVRLMYYAWHYSN